MYRLLNFILFYTSLNPLQTMSNNTSHTIPDQIKWFIIEQKSKKVRPKEIIDLVFSKFRRKITYKTISRLCSKHEKTGEAADRQRSGRPRVFSEREERNIARDFLTHPGMSIKQAVRETEGS